MMERTDRHYRRMARLMTRRTLLYTEMITTGAIIHGDRARLLEIDPIEKPISLQLGGDDPIEIAESIRIASQYGYDEFNLNVGCPSDRVQHAQFGACLMADPPKVARIVEAMRSATDLPVTVKHRVGIDGRETYEQMESFVKTVASAGADRFSVHARIAILDGLSPKENRTVPPLRYEDVYRLKRENPDLVVEINGGITTIDDVLEHLIHVDGVMVGRAAYDNPFMLAAIDSVVFGDSVSTITRGDVVRSMTPYIAECSERGLNPTPVIHHLLGIFAHRPGTRKWKQQLSGRRIEPAAAALAVARALEAVPADTANETAFN